MKFCYYIDILHFFISICQYIFNFISIKYYYQKVITISLFF